MNILITGTSSGIGKALAVHYAERGHMVWAGSRCPTSEVEDGENLRNIYLDMGEPASFASALEKIRRVSGRLDVLINNAGIAISGPIESVSPGEWRRQFEVNFFGLIELTRLAIPFLRDSRGRVVNISALAGRLALPYLGPYSCSKFALEAFSDCLRRELRRFGIRVSIIEPGPIETPIWRKGLVHKRESLDGMSDTLLGLYGSAMEKSINSMRKVEKNAGPVGLVIRAVDHALNAKNPKVRYVVGRRAKTVLSITKVLPDRLQDRIFDLMA